jgi:tRNA(adenine34) deaminase
LKNQPPEAVRIDPTDEKWMRRALELAAEAASRGEIPVGAVLICEDELISESGNSKESTQDPLGHAEVLVIREAAQKLGRWRLSGCTLYVTLEPCLMCSGAIIHARLDRVVYATPDPKSGAVESLYQLLSDVRLNHVPEVHSGVLASEASVQLKSFFRELRLSRETSSQRGEMGPS